MSFSSYWRDPRLLYGRGGKGRPFVRGTLEFPAFVRDLEVALLVDTGADRTILGPLDTRRLGIDLSTLPAGRPSTGVGGQSQTRTTGAILKLESFSTALELTILDSPPGSQPSLAIPSLLGRDILSRFALFIEERTSRVLLLEPEEADALSLPYLKASIQARQAVLRGPASTARRATLAPGPCSVGPRDPARCASKRYREQSVAGHADGRRPAVRTGWLVGRLPSRGRAPR